MRTASAKTLAPASTFWRAAERNSSRLFAIATPFLQLPVLPFTPNLRAATTRQFRY
jgi:hypothetical protein